MRPDLFYIPKRERVAILALAVILLLAGVVVCVCYMRPEEGSELTPADEAFLDSFSLEVERAHQMRNCSALILIRWIQPIWYDWGSHLGRFAII